jgi:hypothetical protein
MSEMLGNQYFMARKYKEAVRELELVYLADSINKSVRRKLIIAYAQTGKLKKSLELFVSLVKEDVEFIINADPIFDDCPCPEIVEKLRTSPKENISPESNLYNGILWLYCDSKVSLKFLNKSLKDYPTDEGLKDSIKIIKKSIQQH